MSQRLAYVFNLLTVGLILLFTSAVGFFVTGPGYIIFLIIGAVLSIVGYKKIRNEPDKSKRVITSIIVAFYFLGIFLFKYFTHSL